SMSKLRAFFLLAFLSFNGLTTFQAFAATHTYKVDIHRKVNAGATPAASGPYQISNVRLTLSFAADSASTITGITVNITEPDKQTNGSAPETWGPIALTTGMSPAVHAFQTPPIFGGITPLAGDTVTVSAPDPTGYDSSRYQRYEIDIELYSNQTSSCVGTQQNEQETYTIFVDVTTSNHPATLSGECLESYDYFNRSMMTANCSGGSPFFVPGSRNDCSGIPGVDCPATLNVDGTNVGGLNEHLRCFKERPGVDAFLVLDKSGSMASSTLGGDPEPKIEALREAVGDLVSAWQDARTNDATPQSDNIAVVLFDNSASFWTGPALSAGLNAFVGADAKILSNLSPNCSVVTPPQLCPGTSTSIGSGLVSADAGFPNDGNRHVILLMSDGMQNSNPMVRPFDPADP